MSICKIKIWFTFIVMAIAFISCDPSKKSTKLQPTEGKLYEILTEKNRSKSIPRFNYRLARSLLVISKDSIKIETGQRFRLTAHVPFNDSYNQFVIDSIQIALDTVWFKPDKELLGVCAQTFKFFSNLTERCGLSAFKWDAANGFNAYLQESVFIHFSPKPFQSDSYRGYRVQQLDEQGQWWRYELIK